MAKNKKRREKSQKICRHAVLVTSVDTETFKQRSLKAVFRPQAAIHVETLSTPQDVRQYQHKQAVVSSTANLSSTEKPVCLLVSFHDKQTKKQANKQASKQANKQTNNNNNNHKPPTYENNVSEYF